MWDKHDKLMLELRRIYNKELTRTKTEIQQKLNLLDIDELNTLNNVASYEDKRTCNNFIDIWRAEGLLVGYFGARCNDIYARTNVRYTEIMELYIYYCFVLYELNVRDAEQRIFREDSNYYFRQGQKQVGVNPKDMPNSVYLALLGTPCANGYTLAEYKVTKALQSAYQIHRLATQMIQQGQKPNVKAMDKEFERQERERLSIREVIGRGLVIAGIIDMILIGINNMSIVEGIKEAITETPTKIEDAKVRFIAVIDDKTTPMCESLHGQLFNVHSKNTFTRWSDSDKAMKTYTCDGLVLGLNLPPITNHFHWCRSTITYLTDNEKINVMRGELISEKNKKALLDYIGSKSYIINEKLYKKIPLTEDDQEFIMDLDGALKSLPQYKGTVYRVVKLKDNDQLIEILSIFDNESRIGHWDSYTSASKDIYDDTFELVFKIKSKTGRNLSGLNDEGGGEILFLRKTPFQLTKITKGEDGKIYVNLEEV